MKDLNIVIGSLGGCLLGNCSNCEYGDSDCHRDELMKDALEALRMLHEDVIDQSGTILYLNRDLERCRKALNAQGEYMYLGGDLISREALMERIEEIDWYSVNGHMVMTEGAPNEESAYVRYADVARVVEAAAAVEAEPVVHAHWITQNDGKWNNWSCCSRCKTSGSPFWKRCPVCEAKMNEEVADGT